MFKRYVPLFSALFNILFLFALIILYFIVHNDISYWYILIPLVLNGFVTVINVINFVYPHTNAIANRKQSKELYSFDTVKTHLKASLISKLTVLPLVAISFYLSVLSASVLMILGVFSAMLFLFPIAIILNLFSTPIALCFFIGSLFLYSFVTSLNAINSVIFMMFNKKIKVLHGLIFIILLLLPVTDFILTSSILPRYLHGKQLEFSKSMFICLLPFVLLIILLYCFLVFKLFSFAFSIV